MYALLYLLVLILSLILFIFIRLNLNIKILITALLFLIFAAIIVPIDNGSLDVSKYFHFLDFIRYTREISGIKEAWHTINTNAITNISPLLPPPDAISFGSVPIMGLIMMAMSFFPNEFLLMLVVFCDYFFAMKIIQIVVEKNNLLERFFIYSYLIFTCLFVYSAAASGIRSNTVGTIFIYLALKYANDQPKLWSPATAKLFFLSFLLILIHPFVAVFLVLLLIATIVRNSKKACVVASGLMFIQSYFQNLIFGLLTPLAKIPFFSSILYKKDQYLGSGATIHISSLANYFRDVARFLIFLIIFIIVYRISKKYLPRIYFQFIILLFCFILGSLQDQLLADRCILILLPAMLPSITFFPIVIKKEIIDRRTSFRARVLYFLFIVFILYVQIIFVDNLRAGTHFYHLF